MLNLVLVALAFLIVPAGGASAASFDCAKASTAFETIICDTPTLSSLDERLAQAYATAIGGLGKPAAETMRRGQRQWLDFVQLVCSDTGEIPEAYGEQNASCMESEFQTRLRTLEGSRMIGGWRVYLEQSYDAFPDTNPDTNQYTKVASKVVVSPRIDSTDPVARALNAFVADYVATLTEGQGNEGGGGFNPDDETADNILQIRVDAITEGRISLRIEDYWYGHGAAHGNYTYTYAHFLRGEERALEAGDVFAGRRWQRTLGDLVTAALRDQLGDLLFEESVPSVPEWAAEPGRWSFTDQGLIVQFQPYDVTAYAYGAPAVTIPWAKIESDLAPGAMELLIY